MTLSKFALVLIIVGSLAFIGGCTEDCDDTPTGTTGPPDLAFIGSDACATCHADRHDEWIHSGHPYKLTEIDGAAPLGAFPDPSAYADNPIDPPVGLTWADVSYTIGGFGWKMRWIQKDGYIYTPAAGQNQYNFEAEGNPWSDYHKGELKPYDCGGCHTTGWEDSDDGIAENNQGGMEGMPGTFFAGGITCESCHGMGTRHVFEPNTYAMEKDNSSLFCGKCHTRGGDDGVSPGEKIIEAGGWADGVVGAANYIKHHEQYDEWYNSPHNAATGPGCNTCHNPHASVKFDATAPGEGVNTLVTCESCHVTGVDANIASTTHDYGATCVDCHMPDASKSATANNIHDGDISTHLWKINTSVNGKIDMFTVEGTSVAIDDNGFGAVTLDFACYTCHNDADGNGGGGSPKTLQQLHDRALTIHTLVPSRIARQ